MKLALLLLAVLNCLANPVMAEPWKGRIGDHPEWTAGRGFDTSDCPADCWRWTENHWSDWIATQLGLPIDDRQHREYRTDTGHEVDIKTYKEAAETEWDRKFHASVGQAAHYGYRTHLEPVVILLVRDPREPYIAYCQRICDRAKVRLYVQVVPGKPKN